MLLARRLTAIHARAPLTRRCSGSAALAHAKLREELEAVKQRIKKLEAENPELVDGLEESMRSLRATNPDLRSNHNATDPFSPPKLHHINIVHAKGSELLVDFYRDVMRMDEMPINLFPRNAAAAAGGSDVPIGFTTDGHMQMHLATQDLGVAFRSGETINPIGVGPVGHIAFRTDDIDAFKKHLEARGIAYTDYGTRFARDWHQIFFLDPAGTIVEVHAVISA